MLSTTDPLFRYSQKPKLMTNTYYNVNAFVFIINFTH